MHPKIELKTERKKCLLYIKPYTTENCRRKVERTGSFLNYLLLNLCAGQETTEPDMEQQPGSKSGKEYVKAIYCHPAYLTYMQNTSRKMPGWMKHKLE